MESQGNFLLQNLFKGSVKAEAGKTTTEESKGSGKVLL